MTLNDGEQTYFFSIAEHVGVKYKLLLDFRCDLLLEKTDTISNELVENWKNELR